ncbi:MAG: hypothetical protein ABF289_04755 [Clostridiales bacterium]
MLKVISILLVLAGSFIVYLAKVIMRKYKLDQKIKCKYEDELNDEEIRDYKINSALIKIKLVGFGLFLPGVILVVIVFK